MIRPVVFKFKFAVHLRLCRRPDLEPGAGANEDLCSAETVQGFAGTLVPLLLEVWVEAVGGGRAQTDSGHLLSEEAMALMFQILTILQLLRHLAPQKDQQDTLVCTHAHHFYHHCSTAIYDCTTTIARSG